jgi:hypothetical protein
LPLLRLGVLREGKQDLIVTDRPTRTSSFKARDPRAHVRLLSQKPCDPCAQVPQQPAPASPAANPAAYGAASPTSGGRVAEWLRPAAAAQTPSPVRGPGHGPGSGKKKLSELVTDIDTI